MTPTRWGPSTVSTGRPRFPNVVNSVPWNVPLPPPYPAWPEPGLDSAVREARCRPGGRCECYVMSASDPSAAVSAGEVQSWPGDFGFLVGRWTVQHHRLGHPLSGRIDWSGFHRGGDVSDADGPRGEH